VINVTAPPSFWTAHEAKATCAHQWLYCGGHARRWVGTSQIPTFSARLGAQRCDPRLRCLEIWVSFTELSIATPLIPKTESEQSAGFEFIVSFPMQILDLNFDISSKSDAPFIENALSYHRLPIPTCRYRAPAPTPPHTTHGVCLSRASSDTNTPDSVSRYPWRVWFPRLACEEDANDNALITAPLP
jgi:hypothetical protein